MPSVAERAEGSPVLDEKYARILERVRVHLNKTLSKKIVKIFEDDPTADFEQTLERSLEAYRNQRAEALKTAERRQLGQLTRLSLMLYVLIPAQSSRSHYPCPRSLCTGVTELTSCLA